MLVAPYLAYMRQDIAFREGEAVSQRVIGALLAAHFDGVATVDPHLHRIARLDQAIPGVPALAVSAAPALAEAIRAEVAADAILVGPDIEARPWASSIAGPLGLDMLVGEKIRHGDREVALTIPGIAAVSGRDAVLVDDMVSSGTTLIACARLLRAAGARSISAVTTHALAPAADIERMRAEGIASLRTADSTASPVATISLAGVLAAAIRAQGWLDGAGEDPASR